MRIEPLFCMHIFWKNMHPQTQPKGRPANSQKIKKNTPPQAEPHTLHAHEPETKRIAHRTASLLPRLLIRWGAA